MHMTLPGTHTHTHTAARHTCQSDLNGRYAVHAELASGAAQGSQAGVHGRSQRAAAPLLILIQVTCPCSIKKQVGRRSMERKHGEECKGCMQKKYAEEACRGSLRRKPAEEAVVTRQGFTPGIIMQSEMWSSVHGITVVGACQSGPHKLNH